MRHFLKSFGDCQHIFVFRWAIRPMTCPIASLDGNFATRSVSKSRRWKPEMTFRIFPNRIDGEELQRFAGL